MNLEEKLCVFRYEFLPLIDPDPSAVTTGVKGVKWSPGSTTC